MISLIVFITVLLGMLTGCDSKDGKHQESPKKQIQQAEYIYRVQQEYGYNTAPPLKQILEPYPWEKNIVGSHPKITKEFFRCKGSSLNPIRSINNNGQIERFCDCGGVDKHSLPLQDQEEFVYPILLDLVNYIQMKTYKRVVITSGHRCPEHNTYVDSSIENRYSKHQIGAEVSFYVHGMEYEPEKVVKIIQNFYLEKPEYRDQLEYLEFQRYEGETNVMLQPWMNKEIFIKLFQKNEGRNFDNRHPYPYVSLQVRYDREKREKVNYSWEKAHRNFLRN